MNGHSVSEAADRWTLIPLFIYIHWPPAISNCIAKICHEDFDIDETEVVGFIHVITTTAGDTSMQRRQRGLDICREKCTSIRPPSTASWRKRCYRSCLLQQYCQMTGCTLKCISRNYHLNGGNLAECVIHDSWPI